MARNAWLGQAGYSIIRIAAADVLKNADEAAQSIVAFAALPLHHSPEEANGPPPRAGEELR